jgi:hypothetical protein
MSSIITNKREQIEEELEISGQKIVDDFFSNLKSVEGVDPEIADILLRLHKENTFSDTKIYNALAELKKEKLASGEN